MTLESNKTVVPLLTSKRKKFSLTTLKISLKYRPEIYNLIVKLRHCVRKKSKLIKKLKKDLNVMKNNLSSEEKLQNNEKAIKIDTEIKENNEKKGDSGWNIGDSGDNVKSIAEQVKEVALTAMDQSGMVYVESVGMYYDYKTGYYYNSELGLYYHTDTGCYYYYSDEKKTFVFHSYPDTSKISKEQKAHDLYKKKQAKKHKKEKEDEQDIGPKPKRIKSKDKNINKDSKASVTNSVNVTEDENPNKSKAEGGKNLQEMQIDEHEKSDKQELEDGECSDTDSGSSVENNYGATTSTASDDDDNDSVSKHHPPCMRVIVKETTLPKLKVGTLFVVTKDGGTVGREGEQHIIVLRDQNVSRVHLDIKYDELKKCYVAMDLGSKNGSVLNGHRMSESQISSSPMAIPHGSTLQLGETKLLCHIHPGTDTCGHCEPGLIMEADSKEKQAAYTRTCSVQLQHQLELARLKNKYVPQLPALEDGNYNDRAKARREAIGSSHSAEKTQQSDLETTLSDNNKGFQLLQKMGWSKGEGLGKDSQGSTEPIPLVNNDRKAGLGAIGSAEPVAVPVADRKPLRMRTKTRPLRPPAKAFLDPLEDDD